MANGPPLKKRKFLTDHLIEIQDCGICKEPFDEAHTPTRIKVDGCDHVFGTNCVREWLDAGNNNSCPMCRTTLYTPPREPKFTGGQQHNAIMFEYLDERTVIVFMWQALAHTVALNEISDGYLQGCVQKMLDGLFVQVHPGTDTYILVQDQHWEFILAIAKDMIKQHYETDEGSPELREEEVENRWVPWLALKGEPEMDEEPETEHEDRALQLQLERARLVELVQVHMERVRALELEVQLSNEQEEARRNSEL